MKWSIVDVAIGRTRMSFPMRLGRGKGVSVKSLSSPKIPIGALLAAVSRKIMEADVASESGRFSPGILISNHDDLFRLPAISVNVV